MTKDDVTMPLLPAAAPAPRARRARRRRSGWLALGGGARAADPADGAEPPRLALLIGNRDYPDGEDLPPIHKNVHDVRAALEKRGFVSAPEGLDVDLGKARAMMQAFAATVRAAPPDATVFFYFSGHGAQVDAENLLVSARINPKSRPDTLIKGSLTLTADVIPAEAAAAPDRRADDRRRRRLPDVAQGDARGRDGLNQVEERRPAA